MPKRESPETHRTCYINFLHIRRGVWGAAGACMYARRAEWMADGEKLKKAAGM